MEYIFTEKYKAIKCEPKDVFTFYFWGDVHRDTPTCDVDRWHWFLNSAKKSDENTYFFCMGDTNDFASISERKSLERGKIHEETWMRFDNMAERDNRLVAKEISFMQGKLLGVIDGNHNWTFKNGKTGTEDLAERMGTEALGWLCHYTISFRFNKSNNTTKQKAIYFVLCHGRAGGKTAGITINQVDDLRRIFPVADVYCMAHDHERGAWPKSVLVPTFGEKSLKQKRQFLCRSGSFKRGYVDGQPGYEVGRLLKPADIGALKLTIGFHRNTKDRRDRIITDIKAEI